MKTLTTTPRDSYGALVITDEMSSILKLAFSHPSGRMDPPDCEFNRDGKGWARNYAVYDFDAKTRRMLVQRRDTTVGKRFTTVEKSYFLVNWFRGKIRSIESADAHKSIIVKLAKTDPPIAAVIARLFDGKKEKVKLPSASSPAVGYKAVALVDGEMKSIYDGRTYSVGQTYTEQARRNHEGGYYWYPTAEQAIAAEVPMESVCRSAPRVIVQVEVKGTQCRYSKGKRASSTLTILGVVSV